AELDRVAARGAGDVVDELHDGVRSLELRPLETTQTGEEISAKPDARQSARVRTREAAGVEPITGPGCVQIARQGWLVQAVVANARFIHPMRIGIPRPTSAHHLGPRVNVRSPPRLILREVFHGSRVIPEEVHPADAALIVDVEIYLADRVVDLDVVWESVGNIDVGIIVKGEAGSVACNRRARERASGDIQTGLAYRDSGCYRCRRREIRDHIGNTVRAIAG